MKKYVIIGVVLLLGILIGGSSVSIIQNSIQESNSPDEVVETTFEALLKGDVEQFLSVTSEEEMEIYARKKGLTYDELLEEIKKTVNMTYEQTQYKGISINDYKIYPVENYKGKNVVFVKVEYVGDNKDIETITYVPVEYSQLEGWYIVQDNKKYGDIKVDYDYKEFSSISNTGDYFRQTDEKKSKDMDESVPTIVDQEVEVKEEMMPWDLDGDGKDEDVKMILSLNEDGYRSNISIVINNNTFHIDIDMVDPTIHIVDIDINDNRKEIAISGDYYSSDYCTHFFDYIDDTLNEIGVVEGEVEGVRLDKVYTMEIPGDSYVHTYKRGYTLHTWWYDVTYQLTNERKLEFIPQEYYVMNTQVVMLNELDILSEASPYADIIYTLWKGEHATIRSSDDKRWCLIENSRGQTGYFEVDGMEVIGTDELHSTEVFDGLFIAD